MITEPYVRNSYKKRHKRYIYIYIYHELNEMRAPALEPLYNHNMDFRQETTKKSNIHSTKRYGL